MSIGANATIGPGVRIKESIVLPHTRVDDHSLILYSIIGANNISPSYFWFLSFVLKCPFMLRFRLPGSNCHIGCWARVEGTPPDLNADKPFAKMQNTPLFNKEGRLNPSITILGTSNRFPTEISSLTTSYPARLINNRISF